MAKIFISYTGSDRDWALWIAKELQALDHVPHIHEWEIKGGDDIYAWMEDRHDKADHVLCVISDAYLRAPYSTLERNAALWQAASQRPGFVLFVAVRPCRLPTLSDHIRRCELFGIPEDAARLRFREFMATREVPAVVAFPGTAFAISNIPIRVPEHFLGREVALEAIKTALGRHERRVAITTLFGLRGAGKTTLAAAYAESHRGDYRTTWWIRAQTKPTIHADLVGLGVRLGWVGAEVKDDPAVTAVLERLRNEGEGILLIYDNAIDATAIKPYLPLGGASKVLVTSNAHAWRGIAETVEIRLWPTAVGADYLIARTGRNAERCAAETLSAALGGLPLAHEQAAAYCERLDISLAEYGRRFDATPARLLDDARHAPAEYHDGLTVAKTFSLAIREAAKLQPSAETLIRYAALLAPEPIPLYLFSPATDGSGELLSTTLDDLDEALAALREFALIERETVIDERDPTIRTDSIRLHRLVRQVALSELSAEASQSTRRRLIECLAKIYPQRTFDNPQSWPRARRLYGLALGLLFDDPLPEGTEEVASQLLHGVAEFQSRALGTYAAAEPLYERALAIREKALGPSHPDTAATIEGLALVFQAQSRFAKARPLLEQALSIRERALGPDHVDTAQTLNNLGWFFHESGEFDKARPLLERALAVHEKAFGSEHAKTAITLNNLALLVQAQGDLEKARQLFERALAVTETTLGPDHPSIAPSLNNLALVLKWEGRLDEAHRLYERGLAIDERALGPEHPDVAADLVNFGILLQEEGHPGEAESLFKRALQINARVFGDESSVTAANLSRLGGLLQDRGRRDEARPLLERALAIREKVLGPHHVDTALSLDMLAALLHDENDLDGARALYERALRIRETVKQPENLETAAALNNLARVLQDQGDLALARNMFERAVAIAEKALGRSHPNTNRLLRNLASLLIETNCPAEALALAEPALAAHESKLGADHLWTEKVSRHSCPRPRWPWPIWRGRDPTRAICRCGTHPGLMAACPSCACS